MNTIFEKLRHGYAGPVQPERDWFILLGTSLIFLVGIIALNAVLFVRVYDGIPISAEVDAQPAARETNVIADGLAEVEELFDERREAHNTFRIQPYRFVDPARN